MWDLGRIQARSHYLIGGGWFMFSMPGKSFRGPLPKLTKQQANIVNNLKKHVQELASKIGERNIWNYSNLKAAANYIEATFKELNYSVSDQVWVVEHLSVRNVIAERRGKLKPDEVIIVGAHYDTVLGSPGADDNASGIAAIMELAKLFAKIETKRTIRFVAFVNEEPPFFYSKNMGSFHYAKSLKQKNEKVLAMLSIESIGYYSDKDNSQMYPFPFGFFYPNKANFVGFVGNLSSCALVHKAIAAFRQYALFPSEGLAAPSWITGVGWSDQWSFWKHDYPAIMVTGTAPFRNPNYHLPEDTAETLDYSCAARVVDGLFFVIMNLLEY